MRICTNCNQEVNEDAKFCPNCGEKLAENTEVITASDEGKNSIDKKIEIKRMLIDILSKALESQNKKKIITGCLIFFVVLFGAIFITNQQKTVKLEDCVVIEYSGYDGYGTAYAYIDYDKYDASLKKVLGDDYINYTDYDGLDTWEALGNAFYESMKYENAYNAIEVTLDKVENIKNGDKLKATITFDETIVETAGLKFKGGKVTEKVENLPEVVEYDIFEDLKVTFSGISPNATVSWEYVGDKGFYSEYFSTEQKSGIKEGDSIVIVANIEPETALKSGVILLNTEKEYKAESLNKYVTSAYEVNEVILEQLITNASDVIEARYAELSNYVSVTDIKYNGVYILNLKQQSQWSSNNIVYLIMSGKVYSKEGSFDAQTIYMPIKCTNVILDTNNKVENSSYSIATNISGRTELKYNRYNVLAGYTDITKMYTELVTTQKDKYNIDATTELIQ